MTEVHPSLDFFGVAWRLGATLFFALLNGFFVAAEFALVKVRSSRIEQLSSEGRRSARIAQHILAHLDRYLSACQLGITLASLILGALGEPAVSAVLVAALQGLGIGVDPGATWLPVVSIALAFAIITTLHMTLGEQAPKMWALRRAEGIALRTAAPLVAFTWLFGPFITAVNAISNALLRLVGLRADLGAASSPTSEEIRGILSLSARAGHISEREHELTANVFRMIELEVRHVVVPRVDVEFVTLEHTLEENLERIRTSRNSRLPVCELGLDTILGFLHAKDVLDAVLRGETPDLRALVHPPLFVSDTMALSDFLLELQRERQHCAVVLDEHGTAIGLAFREDALEEIVGSARRRVRRRRAGAREAARRRLRALGTDGAPGGRGPARLRALGRGGRERGDDRRPRDRAARPPAAQGRFGARRSLPRDRARGDAAADRAPAHDAGAAGRRAAVGEGGRLGRLAIGTR